MRVLFCLLSVVFVAAQAPAVATARDDRAAAPSVMAAVATAPQALWFLLADLAGLARLSRRLR